MRRSGIKIMMSLIGLVRPLLHIMTAAVLMGVAGFLCSIFITVFGGYGLLNVLGVETPYANRTIFVCVVVFAVLRGILRYAEQAGNHYIAFKLLAILRHQVFAALRKLAPAKLEGRDKGNLISIITTDIELLEVFYAHTISPIVIAVLTSGIMVAYIGSYHPVLGGIAAAAYLCVGAVIPLSASKKGREIGMEYRNRFGELNSFFLDSLRGLGELIQFGQGEKRLGQIHDRTEALERDQKKLKECEGNTKAVTDLAVLGFSAVMLFAGIWLHIRGAVGFAGILIPTVAMMSSFGPVAALSSLSNNLFQTLASGSRVLDLLEEEPLVKEVSGTEKTEFGEMQMCDVDFAYGEEKILENCNLKIREREITGIFGASGSGKSTLLKLMMRFWDVDHGKVQVAGRDIREVNTGELRDMESYVTQETYLFHDTIAANIGIAKQGAARAEIEEAAKKASLHEFILSLPNGYDTNVGELGDGLSGGERQRIGVARAFLHNAPLILLDEPTSNLDSLNEGVILKSLKEACADKTIVLVSHRRSTMKIADRVVDSQQYRNKRIISRLEMRRFPYIAGWSSDKDM